MNPVLVKYPSEKIYLKAQHSIEFKVDSPNVGRYISDNILEKLTNYDVFLISVGLSSNITDLFGLELAHHIRLSEELKEKRFNQIVIISDLTIQELNKINNKARILFTENTYIVKNNENEINNLLKDLPDKSKNLKEKFQDQFINKIQIEEGITSHDLSNKWAIYKWSKNLGIQGYDEIEKNNKEIMSILYYKYLEIKSNFKKDEEIKIEIPKIEKIINLLYIDDEKDSGWDNILKHLFKKNSHINILNDKYNFNSSSKEIIDYWTNYIKEKKPNLIILDLRLSREDHIFTNKNFIEKLTGLNILKKIKEEINPGIQVIIFTSSKNSLILDKLQKYGISGYIKKEHPLDFTINTNDNINNFYNLISVASNKVFLFKVWENILSIVKIIEDKDFILRYKEFPKIDILSIFDILNSDIKMNLEHSIITIFRNIETICNLFITRDCYYTKKNDLKIKTYDKDMYCFKSVQSTIDSICNKTHNILYFVLNIKDDFNGKVYHDNIDKLVNFRNDIAHNKEIKNLNESEVLKYIELLLKFFEEMNNFKNTFVCNITTNYANFQSCEEKLQNKQKKTPKNFIRK
ncbi:hypothetical protein L5F32_03795 [Aliarcobacter butzleri]|uniref:MAE_28990/MAE_18760 family HEPN-like nuclease n=1 Tax=Aliarcobacter butzleri TaxID=28197 RepID=UPI001EDC649A|nr:MAE_28990/MAE_18760 family HEPN-like nuclease [Aliarcobacter butzleri]MCG3651391.1 hypothetical protein [Aliarcobacter butzleri]